MNKFCAFALFVSVAFSTSAQQVPSPIENIDYLVTFGKDASKSSGDDDGKQAFYFAIPATFDNSIYIRVFDPGTGGKLDEIFGIADTKTTFTFYGGNDVYSSGVGKNAASSSESPAGDKLLSKSFGSEIEYDSAWYSFGPINPKEGEYVAAFRSYVFKVIAEGITGNDGNLYQYYISSSAQTNSDIEGSNSFTYEFTIRLNDNKSSIAHLYPYIDSEVISVTQHNFDFDNKVTISLFSAGKFSESSLCSGDGTWVADKHLIAEKERESCMDVRISNSAKNNNGVIYMTNQYGEFIPFMTVPIGDIGYKKTFEIR